MMISMINTSATGGPLVPEQFQFVNAQGKTITFIGNEGPINLTSGGPAPYVLPTEDQALDLFFQSIVMGVTGIPGMNVVVRYQMPEPTLLPSYNVNWASVGVQDADSEDYPYIQHFDNGEYAFDLMLAQEDLEILCTFYGPNAMNNAMNLRHGMYLPQNCEPLMLAGMGLTQVGKPVRAPEYIKNQLYNRWDITLFVKRTVQLRYPVLSLLKIAGTINANISAGGPMFASFSAPIP